MNVVDLMTTEVIAVSRDTGLREAARLMFRNRVSGLPVTDPDGMLTGIITEADFLRLEVERQEGGSEQAVTVGEVMSIGVVTIRPEMEIYEAAKIMTVQEVKRLPVVDDDNRLLGVISRADIVSIFTRPDDVIEDEIREDLLRRVLYIDPDELGVSVRNGVVALSGQVGTRAEASMLEELTNRLDGVFGVETELTWPAPI
ncbi:MAG: CBS domain-containing protein [Acidimicrobiia bacterium]|nr:MAG: CBS domain-containing protein [Acidimicrobiia bacterium]